MADETKGTKEMQEAIQAIGPVAVEVIALVKTAKGAGSTPEKVTKIMAKLVQDCIPGTPLWNAVAAAVDNASEISAEAKDLTLEEALALIPVTSEQIVMIVNALKKE